MSPSTDQGRPLPGRVSTAIVCSMCGDQRPDAAAAASAGWMHETDSRGRESWVCAVCARRHLRSIEARLDEEWW